jgi:hypothetical protein
VLRVEVLYPTRWWAAAKRLAVSTTVVIHTLALKK